MHKRILEKMAAVFSYYHSTVPYDQWRGMVCEFKFIARSENPNFDEVRFECAVHDPDYWKGKLESMVTYD